MMGSMRWCAVRAAVWLFVLLPWPGLAWDVARFDGRDYVRTSEVAKFYGILPTAPAGEGELIFYSERRSLAFRANTREVVINGLKHWLSFPVLFRNGAHWVSRLDLSRTIEPALRPRLAARPGRVRVVVLDAGHGGRDKGAIGPYQYEKNFTLDIARRVRDALEGHGLKVVLTRNSDVFTDLPVRARTANSHKNAIFVSLHFNAAANRAAQGFEIFAMTPRGAPSTQYEELSARDMIEERGNAHEVGSFLLASAIYHAMHGRVKMMDRGLKRARFAVLRLADMPGVLVEGGFLSNPVDARRIASPEWRTTYARAIAEGILAYVRLANKRIAPPLAADYRLPGSPNIRLFAPAVTPTPAPPPSVGLRQLPEEQPE
jgi:N-acetylmuramoyl-L-alanine amidase